MLCGGYVDATDLMWRIYGNRGAEPRLRAPDGNQHEPNCRNGGDALSLERPTKRACQRINSPRSATECADITKIRWCHSHQIPLQTKLSRGFAMM